MNKKTIFFIVAGVLIIAGGFAFYHYVYLPSKVSIGGVLCTTSDGQPGQIVNGVCEKITVINSTVPCGGRLNPC